MRAEELAAAAVRVMTAAAAPTAGRSAFVQELVRGRLGRTALGAAALARLHEHPSEGSTGIVVSVLADELRADPDFTQLLMRALGPPPGPPPPPPRMPPPRPAPTEPSRGEVRRVWLLGVFAPVLLYIASSLVPYDWSSADLLYLVLLLASLALTVYGTWRGASLLLRRMDSGMLRAGTLLSALILLRILLVPVLG
ncbi:hypothetical protein ABZX40_26740 [Streptomyces sp. NPDC004610]|uniref:hypothetical protein n=1 Tax=unclassified Streptomyces TaxID=2593676 RepID=UPI0033BE110D